jgi:amino-acid N-acetyltransferase
VAFLCEPAKPHDLGRALELLRQENLPEHGVVDQFGHYMVVRNRGQLVGVCGVEVHGAHGLLRSLVIDPDFRGQGAGDCLVRGVLELGQKLHLQGLYLLTTTAQRYFERFGFHASSRDELPPALKEAWEIREGCPTEAVLMKRSLR